jgi:hypothetical protein
VLDHVAREQVLVAERGDWRQRRGGQDQDRARERERLRPPGSAPAGLAARGAEAPDVDGDDQRDRQQLQRVEVPVQLRVVHLRRDCRSL